MITPEQFRVELSQRLNEVLPDGFVASPTEDGVWVDAPDGLGATGWAGHVEEDPENPDLYCEAGQNVMNTIQDCVSETLREFWPMAQTTPEHRMAVPGGRIRDGVLTLWFGDEHAPTVTLRPIDLGVPPSHAPR